MSYKILLFDLDDTLLDFGANEADSLSRLFRLHGHDFSDEVFRAYHSVNKQLWADYENGKLALEDVLNARFTKTLQQLGKDGDGVEWERQYRELLGNGCQLVEGALEVCRKLSVSRRLFVVTNGVTKTQIKRMKQSGLHGFFDDVFTSQNIGFQKPASEFFDCVKSRIAGFDSKEALIIGDSPNTDIKGGIAAGIDTCLLSRKPQEKAPDFPSTYTIARLEELYDIC